MGSFATGDGSPESDVDAAVIWQSTQNTLEFIGVRNAADNSRLLSGKRLDPLILTTTDVTQPWLADKLPGLIISSRLLHGIDVLKDLPMPSVEAHLAALRARACSLMRNLRDGRQVMQESSLPFPSELFFGYTRRRTWYPPTVPNGTRELVELVAGLSAPLAVAASNSHVTGKRHAIESYAALAEEPWARFVATLYRQCAIEWRYRIPEDEDRRQLLSELCLSVQAFENHYLAKFPC
jgi:hypothetical protein